MPYFVVLKQNKLVNITEDSKEAVELFLSQGDRMEKINDVSQLVSVMNRQTFEVGLEGTKQFFQDILNRINSFDVYAAANDVGKRLNELKESVVKQIQELNKEEEKKK